MAGKCPKCNATISKVNIEYVEIDLSGAPKWKGVSYLCPFCNVILSVQIDPIAIRTDLQKEIANALQEKTL